MNRARSQATWLAAAAAGLEVLTGAGLVVAPSLLANLLFGSEMDSSGDLVGRISGFVMEGLRSGAGRELPRAKTGGLLRCFSR